MSKSLCENSALCYNQNYTKLGEPNKGGKGRGDAYLSKVVLSICFRPASSLQSL